MAASTVANVEMAKAWDGDEGDDWARDWERYDRAVAAHHRAFLDAAGVRPGDHVLDVGCGNGESTRDAARAAAGGRAHGVDLSSRMIERARQLAAAEGVPNTSYEWADAQVHPFPPAGFDLAVSRFGTMFFADPVAAFANLARAVRPGGRLVMVAWRGAADNEWLQCVFAALAVGRDLPVPPAGAPGPFGLADPGHTRSVLAAGGWEEVDLAALDAPFWLGRDGADAFGFFRTTGVVRGMTHGLDEADRARALAALEATMADHQTAAGVVFGSGAWLITARRP